MALQTEKRTGGDGVSNAHVDACSGPCGTNSRTISAPRHDPSAKSPARSSLSFPGHSQKLKGDPSASRELMEHQQAKHQLNVPDYRSAWPSVTNRLMPGCRGAELQYDQKVNNEFGPILWKAVYRNDNRVLHTSCGNVLQY